jgi:hypothetical protein
MVDQEERELTDGEREKPELVFQVSMFASSASLVFVSEVEKVKGISSVIIPDYQTNPKP